VGLIFGKIIRTYREKTRIIFTEILIKIISPLQIFFVLVTTTFNLSFAFIIQIILVAVGMYFFMAGTTFLFFNHRGIERKKLGSLMLLNPFPNVMFYTIPIVIAIFSDALTVVSVVFASTMLIIRGSIATYISERFGADVKLDFKGTIIKLFTFPPFIAIIAASIALPFRQQFPMDFFIDIKNPINEIASAAGAILIGLILASIVQQEAKEYWHDIKMVAFWRFGLASLYAFMVLYLLRFQEFQTEIRTILLIIMTGPPAVFNALFSAYFKLDEKFSAISVATVTLIGLLILPIYIFLGQAIL
jgi:hypothetical protein